MLHCKICGSYSINHREEITNRYECKAESINWVRDGNVGITSLSGVFTTTSGVSMPGLDYSSDHQGGKRETDLKRLKDKEPRAYCTE